MLNEVKSAYILFALGVVGYILQYLLNVFLANHMLAATYGEYSVAIRILNILVIISLFGTNLGAQRFLAKYLQLRKKSRAAHYVAWNLKLISVTFLVTFLLAVASFGLMMLLHHWGVRDVNRYHLAVYMLWIAPFAAFYTLIASFLLSSNHALLASIILNALFYVVQLFLFVAVSLFFEVEFNNITIISVLFFSYVFLSIFASFSTKKEVLSILLSGWKKLRKAHLTHSEWLQASSRLIANNIIFSIIGVLDLSIVEVFAKHTRNAGHYAAVLTIVSMIWLIPANLWLGLKPSLSSLVTSKSGLKTLQERLDKLNMIVIFLVVPLAIFIILSSATLLSHFGPSYGNARPALIIMTIGVAFAATTRIAPILLVYAGYEFLVLKVSIIEFVLLAVLGIPATYYYGITGMAAATAAVMIVKPFVTLFYVRKRLGLRSILFL